MKYNKLVRDKVADLLQDKGYIVNTIKLEGEEYRLELYSLFWREFKESMEDNKKHLRVHYADMLEVIRMLMLISNMDISKLDLMGNKAVEWYKNMTATQIKLSNARTDLTKTFYELLYTETEAIKDQLTDIFKSFNRLIGVSGLDFIQVEQTRRRNFKNLGGFNKGVYLQSVLQVVED